MARRFFRPRLLQEGTCLKGSIRSCTKTLNWSAASRLHPGKAQQPTGDAADEDTSPSSPRRNVIAGPPASSLGANSAAPACAVTREILNAMLPPKSWRDSTGKWQRMVKMTSSTRNDVIELEDTLSRLLVDHQARAKAICHVREKFFLLVFEELIREVTCESPECGLLLLRVRDELRLTIEAYQTLYHSSISYGRKKAVQAEAGITELKTEIQKLEQQREALEAKKNQLTHNSLFLEEQMEEERRKRSMQQAQIVQFLQARRVELETSYHELVQDTTWK